MGRCGAAKETTGGAAAMGENFVFSLYPHGCPALLLCRQCLHCAQDLHKISKKQKIKKGTNNPNYTIKKL